MADHKKKKKKKRTDLENRTAVRMGKARNSEEKYSEGVITTPNQVDYYTVLRSIFG